MRVGLSPTFRSVMSEPGVISAPTIKKAAVEKSPGKTKLNGRKGREGGSSVTV